MLTPDVLQANLTQLSPYLDKFLQNRLLLTPPPGTVEVVTASNYLAPKRLQDSLEAFATASGIPNLTVATSLWNKNYNNALIPAVLPAMTLLGIGLEASLENVSIVLKDKTPEAILLHRLDGAVVYPPRFGKGKVLNLPTVTELSQLHAFVFTSLFDHLRFLNKQVNAITGLPRSVMWGNTGNVCDYLYQELSNCPGAFTATQEDRAMIFEQSRNPAGTGRNPLYRTIVYESMDDLRFSKPVTIRRVCCLLFRMPASEGYCGNCPLMSQEERLVRLKH
ncbi:siderophore-iron reductase FhuF [Coleofasciculus sp.]|uniref:siderophore-iron reductase FhuF n=1 Tax=Coleofasciculus sp. TaxID=3100458 RepID=UPI003A40AD3C